MSAVPSISVIIPTRGRPESVCIAVSSALRQSFRSLEVVVVIDGTDAATTSRLLEFSDDRLSWVELGAQVGAAEARNVGVLAARAEWIAFLDDDDEWLPEKLERQRNLARGSGVEMPVVCGAYWARQGRRDILFGRRRPAGEPLSEYMFCRNSWTYGENALATSVLLVLKALMLQVPFDASLKKHQDWDWALRALALPATGVVYVAEPLSIYNMPEGVERMSANADWRASLKWAQERRSLLTDRAFAGFVVTECLTRAKRSGTGLRELLKLVRLVFEDGEPDALMLAMMVSLFIIPRTLHSKLRDLVRFVRR